ncbi:hypothetical protein MPR_3558 [Myroides profundi]|nr:hypothetical protein MPR_3558 [Myroides profundi]
MKEYTDGKTLHVGANCSSTTPIFLIFISAFLLYKDRSFTTPTQLSVK